MTMRGDTGCVPEISTKLDIARPKTLQSEWLNIGI